MTIQFESAQAEIPGRPARNAERQDRSMSRADTAGDSPIRAVVFDIEGVVAFPDADAYQAGLSRLDPSLSSEAIQRARRSPELYPLWEAYSVAELASADYWSAVLEAVGVDPSPPLVRRHDELLRATWWATIDEHVLELIDELVDAGLKVAALSNSAPEHEATILRFESRFHQAHFSHRTGRRKPDRSAYLELVRLLEVPAASTVFVDDKPRNVDAATAAGLRGVLYEGIDDLRSFLAGRVAALADRP